MNNLEKKYVPSFDIIETSGKAYTTAWRERRYLLRLAMLPFFTKILFFAIVMAIGAQENILRQTLIMLPAYFFEGWLVVHVTRLIFFNERWPAQLSSQSPQEMEYIYNRGRTIFAGIIIYVLTKMMLNAAAMPFIDHQAYFRDAAGAGEPPFAAFFISCLVLVAIIWLFKYMFLYIPLAANLSLTAYLKKFAGLKASVHFLGAWLTCYIPFVLIGIFLIGLVAGLLSSLGDLGPLAALLIRFGVDLAAMIVATICFSIVIKESFWPPSRK